MITKVSGLEETYVSVTNAMASDATIDKNEIPSTIDKLDLNNPEEVISWIEKNAKRV
mgnify:CR=1 FL=1